MEFVRISLYRIASRLLELGLRPSIWLSDLNGQLDLIIGDVNKEIDPAVVVMVDAQIDISFVFSVGLLGCVKSASSTAIGFPSYSSNRN